MSDPYKVLNIAPTATDDEVKHAYRQLARKYHPDNYHDNPLADLAQEKMKEINEAYEQIQKQRKNGAAYNTSRQNGQRGSGSSSYSGYGESSGGSSLLQRIRIAINQGDISQAEQLLGMVTDHGAEWNFLMGVVCSRRGWLDDAKRYIQTACRLDPSNSEYRSALASFGGSRYHPDNYGSFRTFSYGGGDCLRTCATIAACNMCCRGGVWCIPC